jgi:hypothetical protein
MPGSAAKVLIAERHQRVLQEIAHSRTAAFHLVHRAPIILQAFEGADNQDIAAEIGLNRISVGVWRRRWVKAWDRLTVIECTGTKADLRKAIEQVLSDEPRPSRSPRSWRWCANRRRNLRTHIFQPGPHLAEKVVPPLAVTDNLLKAAGFGQATAYSIWSRELGYLAGEGDILQFIAVK